MPSPIFRENYYDALAQSQFSVTPVQFGTSFTTTGLATIWTPTSGKKWRLRRLIMTCTLSTASPTNGLQICLVDNATKMFAVGGLALAAGSTFTIDRLFPGNGLTAAAVSTALKVGNLTAGVLATISTGVCEVSGICYGDEV